MLPAVHLLGQYVGAVISCRYGIPPRLRGEHAAAELRLAFETALARTVLDHPMLQCGIINEDSPKPAFIELDAVDFANHVEWVTLGASEKLRDALRSVLDEGVARNYPHGETRPGWRLVVVQPGNGEAVLEAIFFYNHVAVDGMGGKIFHETLLHHLNSHDPQHRLQNFRLRVLGLVDTAARFPPAPENISPYTVSMCFFARALWKAFRPNFVAVREGLMAAWAPVRLQPYKTNLRAFTVGSARLANILQLCRANKTTLTGLLHGIALVSLAAQVDAATAPGFQAGTAIDMRRATPRALKGYPWYEPSRTIANILSTIHHQFDKRLVSNLRKKLEVAPASSPGDSARMVALAPAVWSAARSVRREIETELARGTHNNMVGLMRFASDWRALMRAQASKPRGASWAVSNIGVIDGGHSVSAGNGRREDQRPDDDARWTIEASTFTMSAEAAGAAVHISAISVKQGELSVELAWQDSRVFASLGQQLLMPAPLDDPALVQHDDLIGTHHRRQTMGDDKGRTPSADPSQRRLDLRLGLCVDGARRLVEHQHRRALHLAARELDALLADLGGVAVGEGEDLVVDGGRATRLVHLLVRRREARVPQVLHDGGVEEQRILRHDADDVPERPLRHVAHVVAVDTHAAAARHVVVPQQQLHERRLARARGADQRDRLARRGEDAHVVDRRALVVVGEVDVVELDLALDGAQPRRALLVGDGGLRRQQVKQPLGVDEVRHEVAVVVREELDGPDEEVPVLDEEDEVAGGRAPRVHLVHDQARQREEGDGNEGLAER
ncbi:alcohol acetyltransferase [Purpureocillium lavendulum]|uniref:Alcohol acetyltransferase n=1 Tax=Purpureocillium lavendulum TaxID=1247861 RepID=A0AB34FPF8_9HYPO|nr:alcohol acetyltransferase [Purpureocillium lavendulum]